MSGTRPAGGVPVGDTGLAGVGLDPESIPPEERAERAERPRAARSARR
ncbi:hypothetical protein [Amnibacterium kyonggiense]